jgi:ribonuclease D
MEQFLEQPARQIRIPVPQLIRERELEQQRRKEAILEELRRDNVDLSTVPTDELESAGLVEGGAGEGPWMKWYRSIKRDRTAGKHLLADNKEELLRRILHWRDCKAAELFMAPGAILSDLMARNIAYVRVSDVQALQAAGVRIRGVEELAELMKYSTAELFPSTAVAPVKTGN